LDRFLACLRAAPSVSGVLALHRRTPFSSALAQQGAGSWRIATRSR
jgi:hypothetical protein